MTSPEKLATPEINHASAETAKVVEQAIGALADILGGWRYIRQSHGDLYGVGWDRCEKSASIAIAALRTEVEALATQRQGEGDLSPADIRSWAEGVTGALGTEYASRVTAEEIALASAILATSQGVAVAQPDERIVKVSSQGVQFGNAWFSHEKITGYSAEQLNSGLCKVTGKAYMEWFSAAPPAPPAPLPYPQNLTPAQADARQKLIGLGGGRVGLDDDYEPPAPLPGKESRDLLQQAYDALDSMGGFGFTQKASKAMHELHAAITSAKEQTK